jgi:predicted MFS family arabinose efflux permease
LQSGFCSSQDSGSCDEITSLVLSFGADLIHMHLHAKSARRQPPASPFRSHRPDARKYRHASASVSLNTSVLYIGQAVGSAIGGVLYARDLLYGSGYVAMGFVALALVTVTLTKPRGVTVPAG